MEGSGESAGEVYNDRGHHRDKDDHGRGPAVVRDEVKADGEPQELTFDWYAQDAEGNVWYFGEDTAAFERRRRHLGLLDCRRRRSPARDHYAGRPAVELTYRQEFYAGQAEDQATVVELGATADTPAGQVPPDVLVTEDWTPLEPDIAGAQVLTRRVWDW